MRISTRPTSSFLNTLSTRRPLRCFRIENSNTPNRPAISEAEMSVMSEFFEQLRLLTGALGYKVFEPLVAFQAQAPQERKDEQQPASLTSGPTGREFHIRGAKN